VLGRCATTSREAAPIDPGDWHPRLTSHLAKASPLVAGLLPHLTAYSDVFYPGQTPDNRPELLRALALHVVNHCLLSYATVAQHNGEEQPPPDQGFTKPKVLVLMPFKNSCLEFVQAMASVLPPTCWLGKKKQFMQEFGPDPDSTDPRNKPADWYQRFHGNIDEDFRIGINLTQNFMKLYSSFYASDIIIASPLGLRRVIGVQGESSRDSDFLSSIEVLVLDQAEVFLMQNFDHLQIVLENLNLIPKTDRGADITRLRSFNLNEWAKYLRQTVLLSAFVEPELSAVFSRFCVNTNGLVRCQPPCPPTISDVVPKVKQVFQRIDADAFSQVVDAKLATFRLKVLPNLIATNPAGLVIFTSSYLEYLSLRNLLNKEEFAFDGLNEYSNMKEVSRIRTKFFQGRTRVVLYTERSHFYNRFRLRGVASILFFSLPSSAHFYPELLNLLGSEGTSTVLFSKWEYLRLTRVVGKPCLPSFVLSPAGRKRADLLLTSDKAVHLFC
jgi:U3 small nucleolar RNA-associated protein 25